MIYKEFEGIHLSGLGLGMMRLPVLDGNDAAVDEINYMDWHFQKAQEKAAILQKAGIPIWVMEPLRGGKLAKASGDLAAAMQSMRPKETVPGWAFRFLQSISGDCAVQ